MDQGQLGVKTPWHLWVIGGVTLLWNAIGAFSYTVTRLGMLAQLGMTRADIAFFDSHPAWSNAFWALGVWGALFGSMLLLFRSRWAVTSLIVSIVGLIGTTIYQNFMTQVPENLKSLPFDAMIWIIALALLYYAVKMRKAGVLR
jgi:hypothetical protein